MDYLVLPQRVFPWGCIVTLVAFVWFFSSMCFQMSPQVACISICKFTLVAFVWLFTTVCSQMSFQITCVRRCKATLAAYGNFFLAVWFHIICQHIARWRLFSLSQFLKKKIWFIQTKFFLLRDQFNECPWMCMCKECFKLRKVKNHTYS